MHASRSGGIRVAGFEEGIRQGDCVNLVQTPVVEEIRVYEEEHGHVNLFARSKHLLLEAKALDFVKVQRCSIGLDIIACHPDDVIVTFVLRFEEGEGCLARQYLDLVLFRPELPWHGVGGIRIEFDCQHALSRYRLGPDLILALVYCFPLTLASNPCLSAKDTVERHRQIGEGDDEQDASG